VSSKTNAPADVAGRILALVGEDAARAGDAEAMTQALRATSRDELLGFARDLGVTGVSKLAKEPLAGRVAVVLVAARPSAAVGDSDADARRVSSKFDLGPDAGDDEVPENIPWGYGLDRITAMAVDPKRLYVYWEVTDAAIETARRALGKGGPGAWLSLRVYDITGRLFDGTNAHSYFDERLDRDVRQWFFDIGKPTSTACVEIGLKSTEGFFAKISRSGRVDFPRAEPQASGAVEWLTVRTATGEVGQPIAGGAPSPDGFGSFGGGSPGGSGADDWQGWTDGSGFPVPGGAPGGGEVGTEWRETIETSSHGEIGRFEWTGPVHRSEWQAGPFSHPVDAPELLEHHESGDISMRFENGAVHVVYGPWQVVIRGLGARAERRVLATWEYRRTIEIAGGGERDDAELGAWEPVAPGSSELRLVGASERRWPGASELVVRGGSEVYLLGASERLLRGASERLYRGATERMFRGASERVARGASERRLGGASELTTAGGHAGGYGGASERLAAAPPGASENAAYPPGKR